MKFQFIPQFDATRFAATKANWEKQIAENADNVSPAYYEAALGYCEKVIANEVEFGDGDGCVCAVLENDTSVDALVVVNHGRAKSVSPHLKMLNMYVKPLLNLADRDPATSRLANIASSAIVGCLEMTYDKYPADELKVYASFPLDREFVAAVSALIMEKGNLGDNFELSSHGNWLVFRKLTS